jgi:hypothetical protein
MKKNGKKVTIVISLFLIIIVFICYYIFNIYETIIETEPKNLFADSRSVVNISISDVNALGFKVPFRKIFGSFEITEGKDLVDIIKENDKNGSLSLRAKNRTGKVVIYVKSKYSFLPSLVEINIYPNTA